MPNNSFDQVNLTIGENPAELYDIHARAEGTGDNMTKISSSGVIVDSGVALTDVNENIVSSAEYTSLYNKLDIEGGQLSSKLNYVIDDLADRALDCDSRLDDLEYEAIKITSFTVNPTIVENGTTQTTASLAWSLTPAGNPKTQKIDNIDVPVADRAQQQTGLSITTTKTWTLKVTDNKDTEATATCTLTFMNKVYWGVAAAPDTYNSAFILGLSNSELTTEIGREITLNATQYIFYAVPHSMGVPTFSYGSLVGGFELVANQLQFTNASGYTTSYDIYKSDNSNLGSITIVVS